jgi:hypothetical protein
MTSAPMSPASEFRRRSKSFQHHHNGADKNGADLEEAKIMNGSSKKRQRWHPLRKLLLSTTVGWRLLAKGSIIRTFGLAILSILFIVIAIAHRGASGSHGPVRSREKDLNNLEITFVYNQHQHQHEHHSSTHRVFTKSLHHIDPPTQPSYNGVEFWSVQDAPIFSRRLNPEDHFQFEEYRAHALTANDDRNFGSNYQPDADLEDQEEPCRRNNWRSKQFPNCNAFHEMPLGRPPMIGQDFDIRYLG